MAASHEQDHRPRGPSRRALLAGTITGAAGLLAGAGASPPAAAASTGTLATDGLTVPRHLPGPAT